jgi:hypothetical protein
MAPSSETFPNLAKALISVRYQYIFIIIISLFIFGIRVELIPLLLRRMTDGDDYGAIIRMNESKGKLKFSEKTCPRAALPSTHLT